MEQLGIQTPREGHLHVCVHQSINPTDCGGAHTCVIRQGLVEGEKWVMVESVFISSGPRSQRACTAADTTAGSHDIM